MLDARRVTCSKVHTGGPQLYGITVHILVARATSGPGFMQSCVRCVQNA